MRRKDREQTRDFGLNLIDRCEYGVMAMVDGEGGPYAVPLNLVRDGDRLYFHCALSGKKTDALRKNPAVCVSFAGGVKPVPGKFTTLYQSATVFGRAAEVCGREEKIYALRLLCEKLAASNMENFDSAIERSLDRTAVWRVDIEDITAKEKK